MKARRITLPKLRACGEERRRVFGYGRIPLKIPCALGTGSFIYFTPLYPKSQQSQQE